MSCVLIRGKPNGISISRNSMRVTVRVRRAAVIDILEGCPTQNSPVAVMHGTTEAILDFIINLYCSMICSWEDELEAQLYVSYI